MTFAFVVNPVSRRCPPDVALRIRSLFPHSPILTTTRSGDAHELALEAEREGFEVIVACGGDGTFREVASAVWGRRTVGFVPTGTVNLVAQELGIPRRLEASLELLRVGKPAAVYGGRCHADEDPGRYFLIGVSAGPDADAVHAVGAAGKAVFGRFAYAFQFVRSVAKPLSRRIHYEFDGRRGRCGQFLALRLPHYGGPYRVSSTLSIFRPGLETIAIDGGRLEVLRFFLRTLTGRVISRPGIHRAHVAQALIELPPNGRYQVDGDAFVGRRLRIVPEAVPLEVLVARPLESADK